MSEAVTGRIHYLDCLRVVAIISVIIIHVSAQNWYTTDVSSFAWQFFNLTDSLVRWAVPLFCNDQRCRCPRISFKHSLTTWSLTLRSLCVLTRQSFTTTPRAKLMALPAAALER